MHRRKSYLPNWRRRTYGKTHINIYCFLGRHDCSLRSCLWLPDLLWLGALYISWMLFSCICLNIQREITCVSCVAGRLNVFMEDCIYLPFIPIVIAQIFAWDMCLYCCGHLYFYWGANSSSLCLLIIVLIDKRMKMMPLMLYVPSQNAFLLRGNLTLQLHIAHFLL